MSLLPLLFSAWWTDFDRPHYMTDQNFGLNLHPAEITFPRTLDRYYPNLQDRADFNFYYKPWMDFFHRNTGSATSISFDKDNFKVVIDVRQFKPEEITVKVVDKWIVIEAKHEEKQDAHDTIAKQFTKRYLLPDRADIDQISSTISSDSILTIIVPLKKQPKEPNEKRIKIELTGKPAFPTKDEERTTQSEKKIEENEVREELTTQKQGEGTKPEK